MILTRCTNYLFNPFETLPKVLIQVCIIFQILVGVGVFLYATEGGLLFTHDSYYYYSAAKSLLADGTLKNPSGEPFTNWPPLYPFIIYTLNANLTCIKAFHCIVYVLTLILPTLILSRTPIQKGVFILYVLLQTFSVTLLSYQIFLLSEGVFVLLGILLFGVWMKYDKEENSVLFLLLVVMSNLLCLQRMMGVYIVVLICMSLLLKKEYLKSIVYGALSIVGLAVWIVAKQVQSNQSTFIDNIGMSDRVTILKALLIEISKLVFPATFSTILSICIGGLILFYCIYSYSKTAKQEASLIKKAFVWTVGYLFLMVATGGSVDEIERFVMPVFPFLVLLVALSIDHFSRYASRCIDRKSVV